MFTGRPRVCGDEGSVLPSRRIEELETQRQGKFSTFEKRREGQCGTGESKGENKMQCG